MQKAFTAIATAIVAALTLTACQQTTKSERKLGEPVSYTSANFPFWRDAFAGKWGKPVTLEGRLTLPEGKGPFPVVIWQHGSGQAYHKHYGEFRAALRDGLAAEGIGLFIADSFTARSIKETSTDQSRLSMASRITDALRALDALSRHPRIDPARIAIAGRSAGGTVAIRSSHEPWASVALGGNKVRFAAHVAFYPYCGSDFEQYQPTGAPLLVMLGAADNYTRHDYCLKQAARMQAEGGNVETVVYPGAHHGFISSRSVYRHKKAWTFDDCPIGIQRLDGEVEIGTVSSEGLTNKEFSRQLIKSGCMRRGVNIGRDDKAAKDSVGRTVAFFAKHLKN